MLLDHVLATEKRHTSARDDKPCTPAAAAGNTFGRQHSCKVVSLCTAAAAGAAAGAAAAGGQETEDSGV